jgi:hypothetical protein
MTKAKQGKAGIDFVAASTTIDAAPEAVFAVPADPSTHSTPIGSDAHRPNPALEPLAPLVGTWRTTGTHPFFPGVVFHGRTSFAWREGGAFLLMRCAGVIVCYAMGYGCRLPGSQTRAE